MCEKQFGKYTIEIIHITWDMATVKKKNHPV